MQRCEAPTVKNRRGDGNRQHGLTWLFSVEACQVCRGFFWQLLNDSAGLQLANWWTCYRPHMLASWTADWAASCSVHPAASGSRRTPGFILKHLEWQLEIRLARCCRGQQLFSNAPRAEVLKLSELQHLGGRKSPEGSEHWTTQMLGCSSELQSRLLCVNLLVLLNMSDSWVRLNIFTRCVSACTLKELIINHTDHSRGERILHN